MKLIPGYSLEQAVAAGFLIADPLAEIAESVRFVPYEDDGRSHGPVVVARGARVREGVIICSGASIGEDTLIGHHAVLRRSVRVGARSVLSHMVCIERDTRIGDEVRVSALTHLTGSCIVEDRVEIGARVVTINDNELRWRDHPTLTPPIFREGCRVGSGATILAGVEIGRNTLVGAGAVVTRSLPPNVVAYGVPAYVQRQLDKDL